MQKKECRVCGEFKVKVSNDSNPRDQDPQGRRVFRDENGKRWNGRTCPKCNTLLGLTQHKNSVYVAPKLRPCPCCSEPTVNRYMCINCHRAKGTEKFQFTEYCV